MEGHLQVDGTECMRESIRCCSLQPWSRQLTRSIWRDLFVALENQVGDGNGKLFKLCGGVQICFETLLHARWCGTLLFVFTRSLLVAVVLWCLFLCGAIVFGRDVLEGLAEAVVSYCQHLPPEETTVYLATPGDSHSKVKVRGNFKLCGEVPSRNCAKHILRFKVQPHSRLPLTLRWSYRHSFVRCFLKGWC